MQTQQLRKTILNVNNSRIQNFNRSDKWIVWLPLDTNVVFWCKDRLFSVKPVNLSQLHPKIPICLAVNFQHLSNGSICRGSPNCPGLLQTCAAQAARNVALFFFSTTACTVVPRSAEHVGAGPLVDGLAAVLAREEGGARHHWKLMFTTPHNSQWVRLQNAEVMDLIPA